MEILEGYGNKLSGFHDELKCKDNQEDPTNP